MSETAKKLIFITGFLTTDSDQLLELNWGLYDTSLRQSKAEVMKVILPSIEMHDLEYFTKSTNEIKYHLQDVIKELNLFIETNNSNDLVVIFQGSRIKAKLISEFTNENFNISLFNNSLDITEEFKKYFKIQSEYDCESDSVLTDIIKFLKLSPTSLMRKSVTDLNLITRIANKLIKEGHKFILKDTKNNQVADLTDNNANIYNKNINSEILSRYNLAEAIYTEKTFYLKIIGVPLNYLKEGLIRILSNFFVESEDIVIIYDLYGQYSGKCIVRVFDEMDFFEMLSNIN